MANDELLMEIADLGSPELVAQAIHRAYPDLAPPYEIERIALEAGIISIEPRIDAGFEGLLMTDADKQSGFIVYNQNSPVPRRRFTISHEIGHFLLRSHDGRAQCVLQDLSVVRSKDALKNREAEANRFAVELLMPEATFRRNVRSLGSPEIDHVVQLAERYGVSKEAAARRYAGVTDHPVALIFAKDGRCRYPVKSEFFPRLELERDDSLPAYMLKALRSAAVGTVLPWTDAEPSYWCEKPRRGLELFERTLVQANGFTITMLMTETADDEDDENEEEERGMRFR
jgi:Zn-dependent peptidase ImmA (M78 family)